MNMSGAKNTASNLFAKTKTLASRTTQKVMVKLGKAEETVDNQFNQESERFTSHHKAIKKLKCDAIKMLDNVREFSISQSAITEDLCAMYETRSTNYQSTMKNQNVSKSVEQNRTNLDEVIRRDFLDPISKYLTQFKEAKHRIEERNIRLLDMDRHAREVRSLQEKGTNQSKIKIAEQKHESAATNYYNLNDELLRDLPKLYDDRMAFFDPLLATYAISLADYYKNSSHATSEMISMVSNINRQSIHTHQVIMTPAESSSANFKATVGSSTPYKPTSGYTDYSEPNTSEYSSASSISVPQTTFKTNLSATSVKGPTHVAKALYDFNAQEANELGFKIGDMVTIHTMTGEWWEGELNGRKGLLPSNYVQLIQ